jgi:Skp family chaperone for outer membrane proteins
MKKLMGIGAGLAAIAAIYVGQTLAQQGGPAPAQAPAQTRVAFINVSKVFLDWEKFKVVKKQMEDLVKPELDKREEYMKNITGWKEAMQKDPECRPGDPKFNAKKVESYEYWIKKTTRDLEDLAQKFEKTIAPQTDQQNVQLYKEVYDAAKQTGDRYGFQVVMGYMEPSQTDVYGIMNIKRKVQGMQMGCVTALYVAPGLDITAAVIEDLNRNQRPGAAAPVTPVSQPKK